MKKIFKIALITLTCGILLVGCGKKENNNSKFDLNTANLDTIMDKLYVGFKEDELPTMVTKELTKDELSSYIGLEEFDYNESLISEPMIGSIPHYIALLRVNDNVDIEAAKKDMKEKINPRKWICVEADQVIIDNIDNLMVVIVTKSDEINGKKIHDNFKKLK